MTTKNKKNITISFNTAKICKLLVELEILRNNDLHIYPKRYFEDLCAASKELSGNYKDPFDINILKQKMKSQQRR